VTRRPPRRAPCLTRHQQVTMRALFNVLVQDQPGTQLPVPMGDRRVGAYLTCKVHRSSVKTARDGPCDRHPRSPLHLDDSGYLGVLSTPIRTQWKGPPASRNLRFPPWSVGLVTPTGCCGPRSNCTTKARHAADHSAAFQEALSTSRRASKRCPPVGGGSKRHPQISPPAAHPGLASTHCRHGPAPVR
jgi:hypothetical protein